MIETDRHRLLVFKVGGVLFPALHSTPLHSRGNQPRPRQDTSHPPLSVGGGFRIKKKMTNAMPCHPQSVFGWTMDCLPPRAGGGGEDVYVCG